ncbi:MAG: sulfite exporter TauE/SafE family protein [Moorea sp. SIO4E2]|uniref:sulfite exporter TauE/SafE family protein n=1 Tax=Moorena sp. SIO4E2 TaxID=2607826 RepID=UPI0013B68D37|nr:sulfite exporter TauE/SafE family protein [Moorena sp. SIO4E2]NEQ08031.1 sulfite exporter TauE/SafE family protein [Moorena sp. SIO4E2]
MKNLNFKSHQIAPMAAIFTVWLTYMVHTNQWDLFIQNWFMSVTMMFASFIAGATAEGGGAVAFPIMTLIFQIEPEVARNFSLAIQSIGMTSATYLILTRKIPIQKNYLLLCSWGGVGGVILGSYYIAPLISPPYAKMFFVSLWLSFGIALFYLNMNRSRSVVEKLPPLSSGERKLFIFLGFLGGIVVSIVGSGIDILTFSVVTIRYRLSEKVATPTSVCLMAGNSIVGFVWHLFFLHDFGIQEFHYWLVGIPVVILGAPLGAYFISNRSRNFITNVLYFILLAQFIGSLLVIQPTGGLAWFTLSILIGGLIVFLSLAVLAKKNSIIE